MTRLWPESDRDHARTLLKVSLYVLRQELGDEAIESVGDNVRLAPAALEVDVRDFEAALARGDHTAAVALHQGPFLDGFSLKDAPDFDHWVDAERARISAGLSRALESLAQGAEERGDRQAAAEWWKARAAQDPYDSRVAVRLMRALVGAGNRAGAIRHASIHRQLLEDELGIQSQEVGALQQRLVDEPEVSLDEARAVALEVRGGVGATMAPQVAPPAGRHRMGWAFGLGAVAAALAAFAVFTTRTRSPDDLVAEITRAVVRELGDPTPGPARPPTVNVVAWDLYVQANRPEVLRDDSAALVALEQFRRAVEIDPTFTGAHVGLARMYLRVNTPDRAGTPPEERVRLAVLHAAEAAALDDRLGEAHATLGIAHMRLYDLAEAETHLLRAVEIEPSAATAREWLVHLYIGMGRFGDALVHAQLASAADPLSPSARAELGRALLVNGRCDEALAQLAPLADLQPPLLRAGGIAAQCYAEKGMWDSAVSEARKGIASSGARGKGSLAYFLARAGRVEEANAVLDDLLQGARERSGDAFFVATAYAGLGRVDETFEWLDRAIADHSLDYEVMEPKFSELHDDPRFERIRTLMGRGGA